MSKYKVSGPGQHDREFDRLADAKREARQRRMALPENGAVLVTVYRREKDLATDGPDWWEPVA